MGQTFSDVHNVLEPLDTWNGAFVDVVIQHQAVLQHVAQVEQHVLRQVTNGNDEQRRGLVEHPRVVCLGERHLGRDPEAAVLELTHAFPHIVHEILPGLNDPSSARSAKAGASRISSTYTPSSSVKKVWLV